MTSYHFVYSYNLLGICLILSTLLSKDECHWISTNLFIARQIAEYESRSPWTLNIPPVLHTCISVHYSVILYRSCNCNDVHFIIRPLKDFDLMGLWPQKS